MKLDLIKTAIENIKANPDSWDQGTWRCGTTYCLAGHIAEADGWKWAYPQEAQSALMIKDEVRVSADTAAERSVFPEDDYSDSVVSIFFDMFYADNTLKDIIAGYEHLLTYE